MKSIPFFSFILVCLLLCSSCQAPVAPDIPDKTTTVKTTVTSTTSTTGTTTTTTIATTIASTTTTTTTTSTATTTTATTATTIPAHSSLYLPDVGVDEIITYFNEVCLDAEFVNSGDATRLQKWASPIYYRISGDATEKDSEVFTAFADYLNGIEGFPGIEEVAPGQYGNLQVYFTTADDMIDRMGEQFIGNDGAVTFWYNDNQIYRADICYRTDIDQFTRNSVIMEELYNGLGPVQDTSLREDSLIYTGFSTPQALTAIDDVILRLLYHPQMRCGMTADECEDVIRQLYY